MSELKQEERVVTWLLGWIFTIILMTTVVGGLFVIFAVLVYFSIGVLDWLGWLEYLK